MVNTHPTPTYEQYKVRKLSWNKFGIVYGISLPREIATELIDVKFTVEVKNNKIIFTSGQDLQQLKREINQVNIEQI